MCLLEPQCRAPALSPDVESLRRLHPTTSEELQPSFLWKLYSSFSSAEKGALLKEYLDFKMHHSNYSYIISMPEKN